jgi:hypothetical protein
MTEQWVIGRAYKHGRLCGAYSLNKPGAHSKLSIKGWLRYAKHALTAGQLGFVALISPTPEHRMQREWEEAFLQGFKNYISATNERDLSRLAVSIER